MSINYNRTGDRRKALVKAISEVLGETAVYDGAPAFTYTVNAYKIDRYGTVSYPAELNREEVEQLLKALKERGYEAGEPESDASQDVSAPVEG